LCKDWQCQRNNNENDTKASHVFSSQYSSSSFNIRPSFKPRGHNRTKLYYVIRSTSVSRGVTAFCQIWSISNEGLFNLSIRCSWQATCDIAVALPGRAAPEAVQGGTYEVLIRTCGHLRGMGDGERGPCRRNFDGPGFLRLRSPRTSA